MKNRVMKNRRMKIQVGENSEDENLGDENSGRKSEPKQPTYTLKRRTRLFHYKQTQNKALEGSLISKSPKKIPAKNLEFLSFHDNGQLFVYMYKFFF